MLVTNFGMTKTGDRLNLNAGRFYYDLTARSSRAGNEIEDLIPQAGMFDIELGQFFNSGVTVPKHIFMPTDYTWEHYDENSFRQESEEVNETR